MTSATKPSGKVSASSYTSGADPYKAFNGIAFSISTNCWNTPYDTPHTIGEWIEYEFPYTVSVKLCKFTIYDKVGFTLQAFVDNTWIDISSEYTGDKDKTIQRFSFISNKNVKSTRYRLICTSYLAPGKAFAMAEVQFYGRQL